MKITVSAIFLSSAFAAFHQTESPAWTQAQVKAIFGPDPAALQPAHVTLAGLKRLVLMGLDQQFGLSRKERKLLDSSAMALGGDKNAIDAEFQTYAAALEQVDGVNFQYILQYINRDKKLVKENKAADGLKPSIYWKWQKLRNEALTKIGLINANPEATDFFNILEKTMLISLIYEERKALFVARAFVNNTMLPNPMLALRHAELNKMLIILGNDLQLLQGISAQGGDLDCAHAQVTPNFTPQLAQDSVAYIQEQAMLRLALKLLSSLQHEHLVNGYQKALRALIATSQRNFKQNQPFAQHAAQWHEKDALKCQLTTDYIAFANNFLDNYNRHPSKVEVLANPIEALFQEKIWYVAKFFETYVNAADLDVGPGTIPADMKRRAEALGKHWGGIFKSGNVPAHPLLFQSIADLLKRNNPAEASALAAALEAKYTTEMGEALMNLAGLQGKYDELSHAIRLLKDDERLKFWTVTWRSALADGWELGDTLKTYLDNAALNAQQSKIRRPIQILVFDYLLVELESDYKKNVVGGGVDCNAIAGGIALAGKADVIQEHMVTSIATRFASEIDRAGLSMRDAFMAAQVGNVNAFFINTDGTAYAYKKLHYLSAKLEKFIKNQVPHPDPGNVKVCLIELMNKKGMTDINAMAGAFVAGLAAADPLALDDPDIGSLPDPYSNVSTEKINISGGGNSAKDSGDEAVQVEEPVQMVTVSESVPTATTDAKSAAPMSTETSQALGLLTAVAACFVVLFA